MNLTMKRWLGNYLRNFRGWRTNRKIVVFESDDWGSIRIAERAHLDTMRASGIRVDDCPYMLNDALESNDDLEALFNLIDSRQHRPVITANFLTSNPDFTKIRESDFSAYVHETVQETLRHYSRREKVQEYWLKGNDLGYFRPQLHGREHLNISQWMTDLRRGNPETRLGFDLRTFGISAHVTRISRSSYQAAFDEQHKDFRVSHADILRDALDLFVKLFGYRPATFIAPNYTWGDEVEEICDSLGIRYFQGVRIQRLPKVGGREQKGRINILGDRNTRNQRFLIRNCEFEPFCNPSKDWVDSCLSEMRAAFVLKKPAIVQMHRVNFVGSINLKNRDRNLRMFADLIDRIGRIWPDVEFMSSDQLAKIIEDEDFDHG